MSKIKWVRGKNRGWLTVVMSLALLTAGTTVYVIWQFLPHVYDPAGASTVADVTYYTSVPPPVGASNFQVASCKKGVMRLVFVRFSAPANVCRKYAETVLPNTVLKSLDFDQKNLDLGELFPASSVFHDMRWFDLPYAKNRWIIQSGQPIFPSPSGDIADYPEMVGADSDIGIPVYAVTSVRVDQLRGVFYFMRSN